VNCPRKHETEKINFETREERKKETDYTAKNSNGTKIHQKFEELSERFSASCSFLCCWTVTCGFFSKSDHSREVNPIIGKGPSLGEMQRMSRDKETLKGKIGSRFWRDLDER